MRSEVNLKANWKVCMYIQIYASALMQMKDFEIRRKKTYYKHQFLNIYWKKFEK